MRENSALPDALPSTDSRSALKSQDCAIFIQNGASIFT